MKTEAILGYAMSDLALMIRNTHRISSGEAYSAIEERLGIVARDLSLLSWRERKSPTGKPWAPGTSNVSGSRGGKRGDLYESGNLIRSVRVEGRRSGFAITVKARSENGTLYGGTHQYGRTIRAKGVKTATYRQVVPAGSVAKSRVKGADGQYSTVRTFAGETKIFTRKLRGVYNYEKKGAKLLVGGKLKQRIPARAMLPKGGQMPPAWQEAFIREMQKWIARYSGHYYTTGKPDIRT